MRIALIGQQDFGKAVLEAFLARGDEVVGVFSAPEKEGASPCVLRLAATERGILVHQFASLKTSEAEAAMAALKADIGIMAYVLQFAPQSFVTIPTHGTIQYHPSLLPKYRGPSGINWPIARGDKETGVTIFRPTDGLDEGPIVLQKTCAIGPDDTLGDVYFKSLFPQGVAAMLEAADLVVAGKHSERMQDEAVASYEGWFRAKEATINWANHVDTIYDTIRASNPAPGAETSLAGKRLQIFDARKHKVRSFGAVKGKLGSIATVEADSIKVTAHGGLIEIFKLRYEDGKKTSPRDLVEAGLLSVGTILGT
jgi:methionyl-tRNA formyltransferase